MEQVDFGYVGMERCTIYRSCFAKYTKGMKILEVNMQGICDLKNLVSLARTHWRIEEVFFFLVEQGNKY